MGRPKGELRDTRRAILDAALDLFAENGFHGTSIRALAKSVGLTEAALYHHFASKEALLDAVIEDHAQIRVERIERQIARLGDRTLGEVLTDLAEETLLFLQLPAQKKFMRLCLSLGRPIEGSPLMSIGMRPKETLARLLTELKRTGRLRSSVDNEIFALHFIAPLFLASGTMWGGSQPPTIMKLTQKQFIREHVAFLVRAAGN